MLECDATATYNVKVRIGCLGQMPASFFFSVGGSDIFLFGFCSDCVLAVLAMRLIIALRLHLNQWRQQNFVMGKPFLGN